MLDAQGSLQYTSYFSLGSEAVSHCLAWTEVHALPQLQNSSRFLTVCPIMFLRKKNKSASDLEIASLRPEVQFFILS